MQGGFTYYTPFSDSANFAFDDFSDAEEMMNTLNGLNSIRFIGN